MRPITNTLLLAAKAISILTLLSVLAAGCNKTKVQITAKPQMELTGCMSPQLLDKMAWLQQPDTFMLEANSLKVVVAKGTDYFNNPEDSTVVGTAPFLYQAIEGDFVAKALVAPDFTDQWNAVALMVHMDSTNWIKFAFENSDATGPGIVSVVTKGSSDDANGVVLKDTQAVWLAIARKGDNYSMHYAVDGHNYHMARLTSLPAQATVKIGLEAQCPVGDGATHLVHCFELEKRTVADLRNLD